ncbi:ribose transport system substrate-binding protein [Pseudobutyrivibrio sp. YE44]|uniref:hypothetical protein n=1 Tax=Pseudobutyrivibrio sp. YE44 TaxID=1520802 RepID=UPI00088F6600|nr:hypothetical protein [Pseudobutyrivibrio sp. YE44]SDB07973.1 ribose transport system substrate-binding protein [Pseudobutyrivibrio sp. YE44]
MQNKENRKWIILFFLAVGVLLLIEASIYMRYGNKGKEPFRIAFVVDSEASDAYENMKSGAANAAMDSNCIIDFVDSSKEKQVEADEKIIVENDKVTYSKGELKVDNESMVSELGDRILKETGCPKILLVSSGNQEKYAEIIDIFSSFFEEAGCESEYRPLSTDEKKLRQSMYNLEQSGLFDCFIALDGPSIEAACEAKDRINRRIYVYGVDNSSESVYHLDSGGLEALAYRDEYSMGYIAVRQLLKDKDINKEAEERNFYYIADRKTMYSADLEKVLFPFVK